MNILIFSKGSFSLSRTEEQKSEGRINTIEKQEFIDLTKSLAISTASAKRIGHPAPFPIELPRKHRILYLCWRCGSRPFHRLAQPLWQHKIQAVSMWV